MNTTAAIPVHEPSGVAEARRVALAAAERLDFDERAAGRVALVVTELATNLAKHARDGEILIRRLDAPPEIPGLEILSLDKGPGIADLSRARQDGHSTTGTLGHGLGSVERQADTFEVFSLPTGTAALACIWRTRAHQPGAPVAAVRVGGVLVAKPGETVCGDLWSWRLRSDRLALLMVDGLGHGQQAHEAALSALGVFDRHADSTPAAVLEHAHAAMRTGRGGAVALLALDLTRSVVRYTGAGNIAGRILSASGTRQGLVSMTGTAGHVLPRIQEFTYVLNRGDMVVLHSDGVSSNWDLNAYPGLRVRHPSIVAGVLYRDFGRRRDDAAVAVVVAGS